MGTKKKLLFVFNPFSGKAQIKNQLLDIVDVMVKADYEVTIYPTQAQGDAIHKIETEAGDYDLVVCSGGDGTLDEVVTGMMHREKKVPLGYIAAGSTNDFATSLGIPKNMVKAAETAVAGRVFPLSLIHISEPTRQAEISYAVFCLKKKKKKKDNQKKNRNKKNKCNNSRKNNN